MIEIRKRTNFNSIQEVLEELYNGAYLFINETILGNTISKSILFYDTDNQCYIVEFETLKGCSCFGYRILPNKRDLIKNLKEISIHNIQEIELSDLGVNRVKEIIKTNDLFTKANILINGKVEKDVMKCKDCNSIMRLVQTSVYSATLDNAKRTLVNIYECANEDCNCVTKVWNSVNENGELVESETISYNVVTNKRI